MAGEGEQQKGRRGALLAKRWLERTTRVNVSWVNPDGVAERKLRMKKAHYTGVNSVFSFDLGGTLRGGELEGHEFLAECKNYEKASDLGTHYRSFLAHCYRAVAIEHPMADQFFWIAFAPHGTTKWDRMTSPEEVKEAVLHKETRDVNFLPSEDPEAEYSDEIGRLVSERLWLLILSTKQIDHLTLSKEHHAVIEAHIIESAKEAIL